MDTALKSRLTTERDQNLKNARDIAAKAESEGRNFHDDERAQVTAYIEKAREASNQLKALDGDAALIEEINVLGQPVGQLAKGAGVTLADAGRKSLGERFTTAPEYVDWMKSVSSSSGTIPDGLKQFRSPEFQVEGLKALVTGDSDTSAGALVAPDWRGGLVDLGPIMRPLTVRGLITNSTTSSDIVEYARVTGFTNNAAPVPEAVSAATIEPGGVTAAQGGLKPESGLALEKVSATVKTIAHWVPATKRALSDAAQVRSLIDNHLAYGLEEELEDQIVAGDGTGENFEGILEVSGTQSQAWDTNLFVTTRKAKRKVRTVGRAVPTAFLLNPEDNERIDLAMDANDRFYGNGPFNLGPDILWGLPRVESEAVPAGTGIVGDFRKAEIWDREQAGIVVSDSHLDFFTRNLVAILAEMRAAFGITRPSAFVAIDLTA